MMAAELMMTGKLGQHLIDFATDLVGRFRGGHAQVSVLGSTLFGGVSGSAVADATALGGLLVPWQIKMGYPRAFCGATIAAASTIDILIPPSIPLILYSLVSNASIGAPVLRRHPARPAAGGRLLRRLQHQRATARLPVREGAGPLGPDGAARALRHAGADDAGSGADGTALRRADPDRDQHQRRRLRDARVRPSSIAI